MGQIWYIQVHFSDLLTSLKLWLSILPLSFFIMPYFFLSSLPYFILSFSFVEVTLTLFCSTLSLSFLIQLTIFSESVLLFDVPFLFHIIVFIPTFRVITHNIQPQFMSLSWVKVHISQCWVRANTRSVSSLCTLHLCFWPKFKCTYPKKDQGQHIIPRED